MKEIIIGMLSGTVAALGMGGGTVLILLFSIFTEYDQHLIFFLDAHQYELS